MDTSCVCIEELFMRPSPKLLCRHTNNPMRGVISTCTMILTYLNHSLFFGFKVVEKHLTHDWWFFNSAAWNVVPTRQSTAHTPKRFYVGSTRFVSSKCALTLGTSTVCCMRFSYENSSKQSAKRQFWTRNAILHQLKIWRGALVLLLEIQHRL